MLVHHRVTPSSKFAGTHLYTWMERGTMRIKCLSQEHNTMSPARARTRTARSGDKRTNNEATAPPTYKLTFKFQNTAACSRRSVTVGSRHEERVQTGEGFGAKRAFPYSRTRFVRFSLPPPHITECKCKEERRKSTKEVQANHSIQTPLYYEQFIGC